MNQVSELKSGKYVAVVAAFQGGSDYHQGQMHLLLAVLRLQNGTVWYYINSKLTVGDEMGIVEDLHQKLDLFGRTVSILLVPLPTGTTTYLGR